MLSSRHSSVDLQRQPEPSSITRKGAHMESGPQVVDKYLSFDGYGATLGGWRLRVLGTSKPSVA